MFLKGGKSLSRCWLHTSVANHKGAVPKLVINKPPPCVTPGEEMIKSCILDQCMIDPDIDQPCVIIIGAGMAGLSAAHRLLSCGITNFKILEAMERPGGRIHTCWLGDCVAELGASMIEGACVSNVAFNLAAQEGLFSSPLNRYRTTDLAYYTSDARSIDRKIAKKAHRTFREIEIKAVKLFASEDKPIYKTLSAFFARNIDQELENFAEPERYDAATVMYGLLNNLRSRVGQDLTMVSSKNYGSWKEIPGGMVGIPMGFSAVLAPLMRNLPECSIYYCKPVEIIRWGTAGSLNPRAVVRCCDGQEFNADYVIVTVPLGVLKGKSSSLFCPELPGNKMEAINKLGFGHVNKLFLHYDRPFWLEGEQGFMLAWSPDEMEKRGEWVKGLPSLHMVPGSGQVLCGTVSSAEATCLEIRDAQDIMQDIRNVMVRFVGDSSFPKPTKVLCSKWSTNPYTMGALTYMGMDSTVGHICDLSIPLPSGCSGFPPIIFFAGEHTSPTHFSTVHGARESGIREANRILQLTKELSGPPIPCSPCST